MKNSNKSVFPFIELNEITGKPFDQQFGLTKREHFAAMAMQGILSNSNQVEKFQVNDWGIDSNRVAQCAIDCADELLRQLDNQQSPMI
jgi:hypothetical protein